LTFTLYVLITSFIFIKLAIINFVDLWPQ
jgi:hypothetical protein